MDDIPSANGWLEGPKEDFAGSSSVLSETIFLDEQETETNDPECDKAFIRLGVSGDHDSPDALLASELNKLSFKERGKLENDIHGIQLESINEAPELLRDSLKQLSIELDSIPLKNKTAYETSQTFPKTYVNTEEFRLIFLRCLCFDERKAAQRIVNYLDLIHYCFGEAVLERDIRISDFDEESAKLLRSGTLQVLPGRDRSGRRIAGKFPSMLDDQRRPAIHRIRLGIYMMMALARNSIDAQKKGVVGVFWAHNIRTDDFKTRSFVHAKLIPCLPIRFTAAHICLRSAYNNYSKRLKMMFVYAIGPENRKRLRVHFGTAIECLYALQTFGIQSHHIPIYANTGNYKVQNHTRWLKLQQMKDDAFEKNESFAGIECPTHNDVVFGRGWVKVRHPGNAVFRDMIETQLEKYTNTRSKRDKTLMTWSIVSELKESGARFLREDKSGWWMEVSNEEARRKVSIGFRDIRKAKTKSAKLATAALSDGNGNNQAIAATNPKRKIQQTDPVVQSRKADNDTKKKKTTASLSNNIRNERDEGSCVFLNMDGSKEMGCGPCADTFDWEVGLSFNLPKAAL